MWKYLKQIISSIGIFKTTLPKGEFEYRGAWYNSSAESWSVFAQNTKQKNQFVFLTKDSISGLYGPVMNSIKPEQGLKFSESAFLVQSKVVSPDKQALIFSSKKLNQVQTYTLAEYNQKSKTTKLVRNLFELDGHRALLPSLDQPFVYTLEGKNLKVYREVKNHLDFYAEHSLNGSRGSHNELHLICAEELREGAFIVYASKLDSKTLQYFGMLIDKKNPGYVIWHDLLPLAQYTFDGEQTLLGATIADYRVRVFYHDKDHNQFEEVVFRYPFSFDKEKRDCPYLEKFEGNPILSPIAGSGWESLATYNPTAFEHDGTVHILYRAQGDTWQSTVGYATSQDGLNIDYRHPEPILWPRHPEEGTGYKPPKKVIRMKGLYGSDGSNGESGGVGGIEDVRVTKIDGKVYALYAAYNGYEQTRLAMCNISVEDFVNHEFEHWSYPKILTAKPGRHGEGIKAGALFPEKVNGKYVMMFRKFPDICIDFLDSLNIPEGTWLDKKAGIGPSSEGWDLDKLGSGPPHHFDAYKIGAGGAPVKTKEGWLLIYQGFGIGKDFGRYRAGALLLDLNDPSKVIARCRVPIIDSTEDYEAQGLKPHVIYPCGTVIKDGTLFVYYGASDTTSCVATAPIDQFIEKLKKHTAGIDKRAKYNIK